MSTLKSAFEYLEGLPENHRRRLYQQPSTALAIFRRMLPHLAKTFVMAMLYMRDPIPERDLDAWVKPSSEREKAQALELLQRMDMVSISLDKERSREVRLATPFVNSLRMALTGGGDHRSFGVPCDTPDADKVGIKTLDDFARSQWESILYFIVGSVEPGSDSGSDIAAGTKELLRMGRFVEIHGKNASITQAGFDFLLQEVNTQVWSLLVVYLEYANKMGSDGIELLSFLFTLGSLEVGQDYSTTNLTKTQLEMLNDLNDLGIVYRNPPHAEHFYPTRLATTLNSDSNALATSLSSDAMGVGGSAASDQKGFIVVETNYRLYAYTSSPLRIAILSLFAKLTTQYPNMIAGKLTKRSVQDAIQTGITAQQIISYLNSHAHPIMATHGRAANTAAQVEGQRSQPSMPPTVVDQIRLWQIEGDRMSLSPGYLFKEFLDERQYTDCVTLADTVGVLLWRDDRRRMFFVSKHEQIASYLRNQNKKPAASNGSAK